MSDESPDFNDVMSLARRWYYSEIRDLVDEAIKVVAKDHAKDSTDDRREALTTWVDETTDGHEFVIYTAKAGMVCAASDCSDTYRDETGEENNPVVEIQACYAMRADIWQLLEARSDEWENEDDAT